MPSNVEKTIKISRCFSFRKAHASQRDGSKKLVAIDTLPDQIRSVAGVDISYTDKLSIGAVAILDYNSLDLVESEVAVVKTKFPYLPTLLSFREVPPAFAAMTKLRLSPDVFLVDGHGVMHPFGLGFASHLGLVTGRPTVGVAKNSLVGKIGEFNKENLAQITKNNKLLGVAFRTCVSRKPIYISIGHLVSLERAIEVVKHCTRNHRIPKPLRLAHHTASLVKQKLQSAGAAQER